MWDFFSKKAFGLDISDYSIKAVQLGKSGGKNSLVTYNREGIKKGLIQDGNILQLDELATIIIRLLKTAKPQPIEIKNVVLSLPESQVFTHVFTLPRGLSNNEINDIIINDAPPVIPLPLKDSYLTFKIVKETEKTAEVFLAVTKKKVVDDYLLLMKKCGLIPAVVDMETNSLARALIKGYNEDETVMVVDIGGRTTIVSFFNQSGLLFTDNISLAGEKFTEQIAETLKISFADADDKKKDMGLDVQKDEGQVMFILQELIEELSKEISRRLHYFEQRYKQTIIKIIITGGTAALPKLNVYLSNNLDKPVELGNPLLNITAGGLEFEKYISSYSTVIGLALRGIDLNKKDINFLT